MIKFFRKIRQQLLSERKTTSYLKYAIGEIILVVIGILIALQINNWSEKQKELRLANVYYCRILEDLELDQKLIEESSKQINEKIAYGKQLILDMHYSDKEKYTLLNDWLKFVRLEVFVPRKVAFDDLISSGNLKLLNDVKIKNALSEYYSTLDNILEQINQNRDEVVRRSYPKDPVGFGVQEFDYLRTLLGSDILNLFPNIDWIHEKDNEYFVEFQNNLVFTLAMYERQKQHLGRISREMEMPYILLVNQCTEN